MRGHRRSACSGSRRAGPACAATLRPPLTPVASFTCVAAVAHHTSLMDAIEHACNRNKKTVK